MRSSTQNSGAVFRIGQAEESRFIERLNLENGLTLEMFNNSRRVAGDRWRVSFVARIEVEVKQEHLQGLHQVDIPFEDVRTALGKTVLYRYEKVRNFIGETEKDEVFMGLKERFLSTSLGYLSSPDFPRRIILRKYQEARSPAMVWKTQ